MAKRRKRRTLKSNAPRRRHKRRNPASLKHALIMNPRRRRRSSLMRNKPRRRHGFRRNPPLSVGGIMQGVQDGAAVYAGGLVARKFTGAVTGMLPTSTLPSAVSTVGLRLVAAVGLGMLTPKFAPKWSRMVTAGAFSETIASALAQTPVAPYLGAMPARRFVASVPGTRGLRQGARRPGMHGWSRGAMPRQGVSGWVATGASKMRLPSNS